MSIWGKLLAGTFGFALGGPIGAMLGVIAGHSVDRIRNQKSDSNIASNSPQEIITIGIIILAAKLAKADGQVTTDEISAFKEKFKIPPDFQSDVSKIFNEAKKNSDDYHQYAQQIGMLFRGQPQVLEQILNLLFYIAEADGEVSEAELRMIEHIAQIFGLNKFQFNGIKESRKSSDKLNPYIVLESRPEDDLQTIRKKYLKLSKEHHPDLLISKGVPKEVIEESKNKMRAINSAWDKIQKLKSN